MNVQDKNQNYTIKTNTRSIKRPLVILATVILVGLGIFYWSSKQATAPTHESTMSHDMPDKNTFYMAMNQETPVLFYTFKGLRLKDGTLADNYSGRFVSYEKPYDIHKNSTDNIDFRDLQNPKKLFTFENQAVVDNLTLNNDKTFLLLSVVGGELDSTNTMYQINLKTMENKKIWEHEVGTGQPPYNKGIAYIMEFIPDRYVVFAFINGNPPPAQLTSGAVIRNILSGKESLLGAVGDTNINLATNNISYKQLTKVEEPCIRPKDPVCFATDKYKMVYKPTGAILTQPLP